MNLNASLDRLAGGPGGRMQQRREIIKQAPLKCMCDRHDRFDIVTVSLHIIQTGNADGLIPNEIYVRFQEAVQYAMDQTSALDIREAFEAVGG